MLDARIVAARVQRFGDGMRHYASSLDGPNGQRGGGLLFPQLPGLSISKTVDEVIVPDRNRPNLDDVPSDVRDHMQFHIVESVDQVLALALQPIELAMAA